MQKTRGAFILARYSTSNQPEDSIDVQVENCRAWCDAHGLPVLDVFADAAVSGMQRNRTQLSRMLDALRDGGADTVVVYDQSRAFRRLTSYFSFREELDALDVRLVSVTQPQIGGDLRDPSVFLSEGVTAVFSQLWALQTRQKVVAKLRYKAARGEYTGGPPPLGYRVQDGHLVVRDDEAEIVRYVFARYAAGATYGQILRELQERGHLSRSGRPFGKNSLHDLLKNKKYIGVYSYGRVSTRPDGSRNSHADPSPDMIEIQDAVPAIVDQDLFAEVQNRMAEQKKNRGGRPPSAREYPLRGKVFCGLCRAPLQVVRSTSHRGRGQYYYYSCTTRKAKAACDLPHIGVDDLETRVAAAVRQILGDPGQLDGLLDLLRTCRASIASSAAEKLQQLQTRREVLARRIRNGSVALLENPDLRELAAQLRDAQAEADDVDGQISALLRTGSGASINDTEARSLLEHVVHAADHDRGLLLSIVARVEVFPDRILVWTILDPSPKSRENDAAELRGVPLDPPPGCCDKPSGTAASTTGFSQHFATAAGNIVFLLPWKKPARK